MRRLAIVTTARSDFGILRPVLDGALSDARVEPLLIVAGTHFSQALGHTVDEVVDSGVPIAARLDYLDPEDDSPAVLAVGTGRGVIAYAEAFADLAPDLVLLVGDRLEMHAAAVAATPLGIGIAHLHGGEVTEGALDDALRHSLTKLAHLHLVAAEPYARRVRQMGEEPWRVVVCGAPALDQLRDGGLPSPRELAAELGLDPEDPPVVVAFHPPTREAGDLRQKVDALLRALDKVPHPLLFTASNADTGGRLLRARIEEFVRATPRASLVPNLGARRHLGMLAWARAMVGNSSSAIIEAPSFALPVVNVGDRQAGRLRAPNVLDTAYVDADLDEALVRALSDDFRRSLSGMRNPYDAGGAAAIIVETLAAAPLGEALLRKRFHDWIEA